MIEFIITDANFQQIKSCQERTNAGIVTKLSKSNKTIKITVNTMAPFAVYKWEQGKHFAISNKLDMIAEYIAPLGNELEFTLTESKYANVKPLVDKARDCSNVKKITCWNTIIINSNGVMQVTKLPKRPYTVPLTSRRGVNLLLKWLKKYLQIATKEIEKDNFIPTLTGGLDTRTLTWFWRDLYHGKEFYLKDIKPDRKNKVTRGQEEVEIASQVLNRLGLPLKRVEKFNQTTFSGLFTENGRGWRKCINDESFIYDYIVFHFAFGADKFYKKNIICPYIDNLYLQLRHPENHFMRTILVLLLSHDLLDLPLYGFSSDPQYQFYEKFADLIPRVEQFIQQYNLRQRVAKIKKRVYRSVRGIELKAK
ncbi:MAG: hypothetical protein NC133_01885 [Prevotella sp.]|nr:hypothetical protein [Prevotella sp.]